MPFTFSHPAIILPLIKKFTWISATGLIIGSMAPDLEYFSRMRILATYGHLWWDGLVFNILISLFYCFIFHFFVRNVLIDHLPNMFYQRFHDFQELNWIDYFKANSLGVIISIIIGIYSHLFWDAFTHEWGFFVQQIPFLQSTWFDFGYELKGYKFLQYFSSIIGLILITFWIFRLPVNSDKISHFSITFWLKVGVSAVVISFIRFYFFPIEIMSGNLIVVPIMAIFLVFLSLGIFKRIKSL